MRLIFYVSNDASQRSGDSVYSPRSYLLGGGWLMELQDSVMLALGLMVNHALISKVDYRQLVYYWFKQRDRELISEFAVKWYLHWDKLTRNRTDDALIWLTMSLQHGVSLQAGDTKLRTLAAVAVPRLTDYVPD